MPDLWWKIFPGRLRHELRELRRAGVKYKIEKAAFASGKLTLKLEYLYEGAKHRLLAEYPETFPYFRVLVCGPDLSLPLHQNPFSKNLCLLGRRTDQWRTSDTLAWLINTQFPRLLAAATATDRESTVSLEENQGEPATTFYPYLADSAVLVDSEWIIPPECSGGWLLLGIISLRPHLVRAAVIRVCDHKREPVARASSSIEALYGKKAIWVRWTRHNDVILCDTAAQFFQTMVNSDGLVQQFCWRRSRGHSLDLTGVLMQEEVARGRKDNVWVFVLREARQERGLPRSDPGRTKLVQTQRAGRRDFAARTPETSFLQSKRISVVGLGCVGAPAALELAKAGCGALQLMDSDIAEAGQTIRWPVGLQLIGQNKAEGLAAFVNENWPYAQTSALNARVGSSSSLDEEMVRGVDLVLDCSAEEGVQRYLADICRRESKTFIFASGTPGARGGRVVVFRPEPGGFCFKCWEMYQNDGAVANPPEDSEAIVQPTGCADPTFTGAGFDLSEVSLMAARMSVGELGRGEVGAYPRYSWNVAILSLRDSGGDIILPKWTGRFLNPHVSCTESHS